MEVNRHPEVKLLYRRKERLKQDIRTKYGAITRAKGTDVHRLYVDVGRQL